jgi:hypothetical protein
VINGSREIERYIWFRENEDPWKQTFSGAAMEERCTEIS